MSKNCLLWFRKDLRLNDNPALENASKYGNIFPLFIFDSSLLEYGNIGSASLWWLENSLIKLNKALSNRLIILEGDSFELVPKVCNELNATAVFWNRCYEPDRIKIDSKIKKTLLANNINAVSTNASLLWEPWTIKNQNGNFYKVFTPFYKRGCLTSKTPRLPLNIPKNFECLNTNKNLPKYKFHILNKNNHWSKKFERYWTPGEDEARCKLKNFLSKGAKDYSTGRNFPFKESVSRLSPYLHWGEISPFQVWHLANKNMHGENKNSFLTELGWREFSYYLLFHFPKINTENLKSNFNNFKWEENDNHIELWKKGKTGYPIVDAGMRELWETGYMHNRARMITSSFLVKNLLTHWKHGEKWFWDCLLDADLANNSAGWQWVAGTGTDAAPFFRIFNPITQSEKFDGQALYIKKFLPELSNLPDKYIFSPWNADKEILEKANVNLGIDYPKPIIEYQFSRKRALKEFDNMRNKNS